MEKNGRLVLSSLIGMTKFLFYFFIPNMGLTISLIFTSFSFSFLFIAEFTQDKFVIDIEASEPASHHRTKAKVHLWIYEPKQLIKLVVNMPPMQVNREKRSIVTALKNVTQKTVVLDEIKYHISPEGSQRRDMTDMYIHVVDRDNNIIEPNEVVEVVDSNYDTLSKVYIDAGIQKIIPASTTEETTSFMESLDPNLAALIALLIVLFIGVILFSILCCCIKNWAIASAAAKATKPKLPPGKNTCNKMQ